MAIRTQGAAALGIIVLGIITGGCKDRPDPRDAPQVSVKPSNQAPSEAQVTLKTDDGWSIYGDMAIPTGKPVGAVVLLHQRNGVAADWKPLSDALLKVGIASLSLDLRGSGRSSRAKSESGDQAPWDTQKDISAAVHYLKEKEFRGHIGLVGASYGANNALIYAAVTDHQTDIKCVSLFSPGAVYHDLDAATAAKSWLGPIQIVYGRNDTIAGLGPLNIRENSPSHDKVVNQYDSDRHGTDLLNSDTIDECVLFLTRTLR